MKMMQILKKKSSFLSKLVSIEKLWLSENLPICEAQAILQPECTEVHEASFKIWQNCEATKQMGEFSLKQKLKFKELKPCH